MTKKTFTIPLMALSLFIVNGCSTTHGVHNKANTGASTTTAAAATKANKAATADNAAAAIEASMNSIGNNKPIYQNDPFEHTNRKIYAFNNVIDKAIIKPITQGYNYIVPNPAQKCVSNFFSNVGDVSNIVNDILQLNVPWALTDTWRVITNTTIGIGGLFNVASKLGLPNHHEDFGLTLAHWGMDPMPFIMIPFLGPSTIRDAIGIPVNWALDPTIFVFNSMIFNDFQGYGLTALHIINIRDALLASDKLREESFDPYVFVRDAYLQHRANLEARNLGKNSGPVEEEKAAPVI